MTPTRKYCFLRTNPKLRMAIQSRLKDRRQVDVYSKLGIDKSNFHNYVSGKHPKALTQWEVLQVAKELGIELILQLNLG